MRLTAEALSHRPRRGSLEELTTALVEATESERLAFGQVFRERFGAVKRGEWWRVPPGACAAYGVTALATMPSAAQAAAVLGRRDVRDWWRHIPVPPTLRVVRARELPWLGDLAARLAGKLTPPDAYNGGWRLLSALLVESGTTPPVSEAVVRSWVFDALQHDRLRSSPHLDDLLPAVFEIDGLGGELTVRRDLFGETVAALVAEGRLERKVVLAATLDRLVRGDRPGFLRPFAALHELLAPTPDEMAGHALDYAQLLPGAPSAIAGLAQRSLRTVDEAERLDLETLLEVSRPTLVRGEKTLVKAQLTWLDKVARRSPGRAGEILPVVAAALGHPALDVRERALVVIERHRGDLDLSWLPATGGVTGRALAVPDGLARPDRPAVPDGLTWPDAPAVMPAPVGGAGELAEEVAALLRDPNAVRWERVLAGLAALRTGDDLAPLRHLAEREQEALSSAHGDARRAALGVAIRSVLEPSRGHLLETGRTWLDTLSALRDHATEGTLRPDLGGAPTRLLTLRIAEIAVQSSRAPLLMATPTHVNGSLDGSVLVERLRRAEREGWEPLPLDLEQALLRVPRGTSPSIADGLTSQSGRRLATWLAGGGLPDPVSTRVEQAPAKRNPRRFGKHVETGRLVADLDPVRPGVLTVEEQLLSLSRSSVVDEYSWAPAPAVLAATLPHHREVCAAWALPGLAAMADHDRRGFGAVLPLLADNDGPFGPAMALAVAYQLAARHEQDRAAAVDAFLTLTARRTSSADTGGAFGAAVGSALGDLAARGMVKLNRAVLALADARRAGASAAVWDVVVAALPTLLPVALRGLPDLLEVGSLAAVAVDAHDEIPGLAELAGRRGSTRLLQEARRLHSVLAAPGADGTTPELVAGADSSTPEPVAGAGGTTAKEELA
ncbi:MAG: DUF6493 family protein [Actinomycetota bacterium]|nr:DUF6493 family protein [Actinomycetota bacterium]